jgi:hypothetical protein
MRYKITIVPFMSDVHITVTSIGEEIGSADRVPHSYVMLDEEGETDKLYDILSWLAAEIAADQS